MFFKTAKLSLIMLETHPNFKSFISRITNGMELYSDLLLVFQFQHLFHKIIPPCEKNAWIKNKQNPHFFIFKHQEVDRVYKYSKAFITTNTIQYNFIGRINNVYYIYVNGIITKDYSFYLKINPSIVNGYIFLSENLNLFLRCVFDQYFQTNAFNSLYNGIFKGDNDNFQESYSNLQQQILTTPAQKNSLLNICIQMVRNNLQYYEIPSATIIKDIIEEENITEAVKAFTEKKRQRRAHRIAMCKVCRKNGEYINYYFLDFDSSTHQLDQNQLCIEMLNFHCDNILNYQYLFQQRKIDGWENYNLFQQRIGDDNATRTNIIIQPKNIDRLYYIHNGYFDLDKTYLCKNEGHEVTVVGRVVEKTKYYYFYINGYTVLPRRGDYKGGFIFWAKDVNLLMKFVFMNLKSISDKQVIENNLLVYDGIIIDNNNDEIYHYDEWDKNYYDIFLNSRTASHYTNCRICFSAKFNTELFDRLIYSPEDFSITEKENKHRLNKNCLHPSMLNYYCNDVLKYQHLFRKKIPPHEENYLREKIENLTIKNIDQIYYIYNELYDSLYLDRNDHGYEVKIYGKTIINNGMAIYFNLTAWTRKKYREDIGNFKWGFIFFTADLNLFMDIILSEFYDENNEWRQFIINKIKVEENYLVEECFIGHKDNKGKFSPDYCNMLNDTQRFLYDKAYKLIKFNLVKPHYYNKCKLCDSTKNHKLCNYLFSLLNDNAYERFEKHYRFIKERRTKMAIQITYKD